MTRKGAFLVILIFSVHTKANGEVIDNGYSSLGNRGTEAAAVRGR
jgi:hypothetical protein